MEKIKRKVKKRYLNKNVKTFITSMVNGLSRLTTTSNGQARPIRKFANRPMTFESNGIGTADLIRISKLRRSLQLMHRRQAIRSEIIRIAAADDFLTKTTL